MYSFAHSVHARFTKSAIAYYEYFLATAAFFPIVIEGKLFVYVCNVHVKDFVHNREMYYLECKPNFWCTLVGRKGSYVSLGLCALCKKCLQDDRVHI